MKHHAQHSHNMRAKHLLSRTGYASGGDVAQDKAMISKAFKEHDAQLHDGKKTHLKLKTGGTVEGKASGGRLDKMARGGHKKHKAHVTVNVLNHPGAGAMPPPPPMPPPAPIMPPGGPMPGGPMAGPGGPPMSPGGMKSGGRMAKKKAMGGMMGAPTQGYSKGPLPPAPMTEPHLARGGRLGGKPAPHMTGGAASGVGREEKADLEERKAKPKAK